MNLDENNVLHVHEDIRDVTQQEWEEFVSGVNALLKKKNELRAQVERKDQNIADMLKDANRMHKEISRLRRKTREEEFGLLRLDEDKLREALSQLEYKDNGPKLCCWDRFPMRALTLKKDLYREVSYYVRNTPVEQHGAYGLSIAYNDDDIGTIYYNGSIVINLGDPK